MKKNLALLLICFLPFISCKDKKSKVSTPVVKEVITPEIVEEDTLSIKADTLAVEIEEEEQEEIFNEESFQSNLAIDNSDKPHKYFLIGGSFIQYENAQRYQQKLINDGYSSEIIERPEGPNSQFYKVSYMSFSSWNNAVEQYKSERYQTGKEDVWILVRN